MLYEVITSYNPTYKGHPKQIRRALEMLAEAKSPVILVGGGVIASGAAAEVLKLAETVITSYSIHYTKLYERWLVSAKQVIQKVSSMYVETLKVREVLERTCGIYNKLVDVLLNVSAVND